MLPLADVSLPPLPAPTRELWHFLPIGYLFSILIETPILLIGLSRSHRLGRRLFAGVWLTACTYPLVVLVIPILLPRETHPVAYLAVAEGIAHLGECALFVLAYHVGTAIPWRNRLQDYAAILAANMASFLIGEWWNNH